MTGAVPFTGWALDDVEVTRVMICRAAFGAEVAPVDPNCGGAAQIFVGFAVFIDGARPDVEAAYPDMPVNTRAGWGFMVLTNMLPNQGNGTYQFYHVGAGSRRAHDAARDADDDVRERERDEAVRGDRYADAGRPASGSELRELRLGVDAAAEDDPDRRVDDHGAGRWRRARARWTTTTSGRISKPVSRVPEHRRANGAVGFRVIDTTTLTNGLHTISWTVIDNQGATEGIGSRFFTVSNGAGAVTAAVEGASVRRSARGATLLARHRGAAAGRRPVLARRGWDLEAPWQSYGVARRGATVIRGEEIDRFELRSATRGRALHGAPARGRWLAPLPVGSQLDPTTGVFTWAPGVGFVGRYDLVFVRWVGTRPSRGTKCGSSWQPKGSGHVGPQVVIDTPRSQQDVGQPFVLAGWAADLDAAEGTGIATLHAWAYPLAGGPPVFLGATTYGGARPDVAAVHGDQFAGVRVWSDRPGADARATTTWRCSLGAPSGSTSCRRGSSA